MTRSGPGAAGTADGPGGAGRQPSWERHRAGEKRLRADAASGDRSPRLQPRAVPARHRAHGVGLGGAGAEVPLPGDGRRGAYGGELLLGDGRGGYGGELLPDQGLGQAQAPMGLDLGEHTLANLLGSIFDLTHRQLSGLGPG
ncbi:hypothetical protein [Streptomyces sp. NPDC001601]|uniref:hypothetical protein n=1 Tax=Streptomyces sp. NPDC001601 TaxID=3364592 RepID=UPI0036C760CC